jgi:hypothetical protein
MECHSLSYQAWAAHLQGEVEQADLLFRDAERVEKEDDSTIHYLTRVNGARYSAYLAACRRGRQGLSIDW